MSAMPIDVEIRELPARRVAYVRAVGHYPSTLPQLWGRFGKIAGSAGLFGKGSAISVLHDDMSRVPPEECRGDASVEIGDDVAHVAGLEIESLPGGRFAVATHRGPYEHLRDTWSILCGEWLLKADHRRREAPALEIYLNGPNEVAPADLLTEICVPIEPRSSDAP